MATYTMISVEEAAATILAHVEPLGTERLPASAAYGRVLAREVRADAPMPPFNASTMDGYAVLANDQSPRLKVLGIITAGRSLEETVVPGTAVRIMTGAPLPPGADAVIMQELTREDDGYVILERSARLGESINPRGQDIAEGQVVLAPGSALGAAELGLLATLGVGEVEVYRRPRVAVLSTGDELVEADQEAPYGAIRDSNRPSLLAAIREAGGEPFSLGIARDDEDVQRRLVRQGLDGADVLVTSGGVSVGTRDLIKPLLEEVGTVYFGSVALKPGKPLTFAKVGEKTAFGLPGNPVSSLVSFEVFVRPALRKLQGYARLHRATVEATLEHDVRKTPDRTEYARGMVVWRPDGLYAKTTGLQSSSRLLSMVGANALLHIPKGEGSLAAGTRAQALLIGELVTE
ncbi:MAG TPA: gephyrin-like molybdotransferase Glp [Chloroflexota bacterium]|jgi:molybdopterin molybdotransferase